MNGCQSCFVKPSCNGRIQLPSGGLVLRPDPQTCRIDGEGSVNILPAQISQDVPYSSVSDLQDEIMDHVRVNFAQLNDADMTDAPDENVVEPFVEKVLG